MRNGAPKISGRKIIIREDAVFVDGEEVHGGEAAQIRSEIAAHSKRAIQSAFGGSSRGVPQSAITIQHQGKVVNIIGRVISTDDGKLRLAS